MNMIWLCHLGYALCEVVVFDQLRQVDSGFVGHEEYDARHEKLVISIIVLWTYQRGM